LPVASQTTFGEGRLQEPQSYPPFPVWLQVLPGFWFSGFVLLFLSLFIPDFVVFFFGFFVRCSKAPPHFLHILPRYYTAHLSLPRKLGISIFPARWFVYHGRLFRCGSPRSFQPWERSASVPGIFSGNFFLGPVAAFVPFPTLTIILTPLFNQINFVARTLRSVHGAPFSQFLQGFPTFWLLLSDRPVKGVLAGLQSFFFSPRSYLCAPLCRVLNQLCRQLSLCLTPPGLFPQHLALAPFCNQTLFFPPAPPPWFLTPQHLTFWFRGPNFFLELCPFCLFYFDFPHIYCFLRDSRFFFMFEARFCASLACCCVPQPKPFTVVLVLLCRFGLQTRFCSPFFFGGGSAPRCSSSNSCPGLH